MTAINDTTGDPIQSRTATKKFRDGWGLAFSKSRDELSERAANSDSTVTFTKGDFAGMTREEAKEEMKRVLFGG